MQQVSCSSFEEVNSQNSPRPLPTDDISTLPHPDLPSDNLQPSPRPFLSEPSHKDSDDDIPEEESKPSKLYEENKISKNGGRSLWPQMESVIRKIQRLEDDLAEERCKNSQLQAEVSGQRKQLIKYKEEIKKHLSTTQDQHKMLEEANSSILTLKDQLQLKETALQQQQEVIGNLQVSHLEKIGEAEQRIKKLTMQQRESNQRVRKVNVEIQKEKTANIELKKQMINRIEKLQSDKEFYLMGEVQKYKSLLEKSKEEREISLGQEIVRLKALIYHLTEQLHKKSIEVAFMERKKQQAINQTIEKKDKQIKMQKMLFKSMQEKLGKIQEQNKGLKKKGNSRSNRLIDSRPHEEEVVLELSP